MNNAICDQGITGSVVEEIVNRTFQNKVFDVESNGKSYTPITTEELLFEIKSYKQERMLQ